MIVQHCMYFSWHVSKQLYAWFIPWNCTLLKFLNTPCCFYDKLLLMENTWMDQFLPHCTSKFMLPSADKLVLLLRTAGNFLGAGNPNTSKTKNRNTAADGYIPSKLPALPNSHLVWEIALKSYENIQPQTKTLSICSPAQPGISACFHSWGWPEHLQLAAPEKKGCRMNCPSKLCVWKYLWHSHPRDITNPVL